MHGMPIAIMAFMALQRSVIIPMPEPMPEPSMGIILTTIPSLVISQVIRHIIGIAIIGMPMGIMPGIMPGIIPPIIEGIMPGIIPFGIMPGMPAFCIGMPPGMGIGIALIGVITGSLGFAEGRRTRLRYARGRAPATHHTG